MADFLSILASLFACASMSIYFFRLTRGRAIPNPATWVIWLVIGLINAATYFRVVHDSWLRSLALIAVTSGILAVTIYAFFRGRFSRFGGLDGVCFVLALAVGVLWQRTGNPVVANLVLQGVYAISFVPTVVGLHRGELKESAAPWVFALFAYSFMIFAVILSWGPNSWVALAHPIVNGLLGNGVVAYYALRQRQKIQAMSSLRLGRGLPQKGRRKLLARDHRRSEVS